MPGPDIWHTECKKRENHAAVYHINVDLWSLTPSQGSGIARLEDYLPPLPSRMPRMMLGLRVLLL